MNRNQLDDDQMVLIFGGIILGPVLIGALATRIPDVTNYLVTVGVLTRTDPVISFGGQAGLDVARITVVAAVLVIVLTWSAVALRRRSNHTEQEQ